MKKLSVVDECPIDTTINVLKGKCKAGIILKIHEGLTRFGQLKNGLTISIKLLALQLNELEEDGIVIKEKNSHNPLQTSYQLTADGKSLCSIIVQMKVWGNGYKPFIQLTTNHAHQMDR
jgi:DNA-binding HxlR family transcriptional regulator